MSKKNLSSVTASVIDSYGNTARNVISVYRVGGERVIDFVDQRFEAVVHTGTARLGAGLRSNLIGTQQRLSGYYSQSLHYGSDRAESVVDAAVDLAHKGARRIAANAERFDQATGLGALEAIHRVALPAATAVSQFAQRIERGSSRLAQRVSRQPALARGVAKQAKQAKAAARQATTAKHAAAKRAGKASTQAAAKAAAARKTVARQATAVARQAKAAMAEAAAA